VVALSFGTLPQWLTVFSILALGIPIVRGATGIAVKSLRDEKHELERLTREQAEKIRVQTAEIMELRATRDLAPVQSAMVEAMGQHEQRAADRAEKVLAVLDLIAARLGPNADS
jgi:tRNA A37 N6-isopentenylltransferase MiaA